MDAKPLKAVAKSGATQPKASIAGQPDPLAGPEAAKGGASQAQTGRAVRLPGLEFPGCKPVRMTREDIASFEGRLEFWDADAATAWICEPTSPHHERPSRRLTRLVERIALVRGSPFECYGQMDLLLRDRQGHARRIMQADESLYLHPAKARLPGVSAMVVGEDDFPDLVLEVDHSTDMRRGKLKLYESWGFPEIWVEVPEQRAPSRPRSRLPGLTIYLLEGDAYEVSPESRAFPSWTAEEIHAALNEAELSAQTVAALERVGASLGAREGTGPDDDPQMRDHLQQALEKGRAEGEALGRAEGEALGRSEGLAKVVRQILTIRGIAFAEEFPANVPRFAEASEEAAVKAASACDSETDFRVRLRDLAG